MAAISPVNTQATSTISQVMSRLNNKTICLLNSTKNGLVSALSTLKCTALRAAHTAFEVLKAIFIGAISIADKVITTVSSTFGPYYPIIAVSIVALSVGVLLMYSLQNKE
jgi:hypothetical protein